MSGKGVHPLAGQRKLGGEGDHLERDSGPTPKGGPQNQTGGQFTNQQRRGIELEKNIKREAERQPQEAALTTTNSGKKEGEANSRGGVGGQDVLVDGSKVGKRGRLDDGGGTGFEKSQKPLCTKARGIAAG